MAEICRRLGLSVSPGNRRTLRKYAAQLGLDLKALAGQSHGKGRPGKGPRVRPLKEILVENSTYGSGSSQLKARLLNAGLLKNACYECGLGPKWNQKPLTLQLDHINGDPYDNRIANLRILCPNCHAQTPTFKLGKRGRYVAPCCADCGTAISRGRTRCQQCAPKHGRKTKIEWPHQKQLLKLVEKNGFRGTGKLLGVSDTAVRKRVSA